MTLEDIGFYTLSDRRAREASDTTPLQRCELLLTPACNLKCTYCRGVGYGELTRAEASYILNKWIAEGLRNVRFSGGEPTLWPWTDELIKTCYDSGVERIAISTNGQASESKYGSYLRNGMNDVSISLDSGCCAIGDAMSGVGGAWEKAVKTIRFLSRRCYVTVGMVFTEENVGDAKEAVEFVSSLGSADIRVIPSAQYNQALLSLGSIDEAILRQYPILSYRVNNIRNGRSIRGISDKDTKRCPLVLDDMACAGDYHFPCIIYLREKGNPIGKVTEGMREQRKVWSELHDTHADDICRVNCLDVCVDYNNRWAEFHLKGGAC